ncbi:MAG: acetyl-CoA hydrolase/transferase C-terminal domain-containing protein [Pseudomonadota bacterium]
MGEIDSQLLAAGQRVFVAGAANEPQGLLAQLATLDLPPDLCFVQFPIGGLNTTDFTALAPTARVETFFMTPQLAKADPARVHFLPMHMRWVNDHVSRDIDVALLQVAKDRHGVLRLGPNSDFTDMVLSHAPVIIAELNTAVVAPAGAPRVPLKRLTQVVETHRPLPEMAPPKIDAAAQRIGQEVAALIQDGDCIQTGIGAIPAAILLELKGRSDLGMHGGLIDDGGMALIDAGNINGSRKAIDTHQHVTALGLGTEHLYQRLAERADVVFRGADHTHEASVIGQLDNFVSINSAVQVDLSGQINAEVVGGRQISGTGGSVDFMRAAKSSRGGRSIVALNATARGGSVSRIVPRVEHVTALRTDVDIIVTEYGVAKIGHLPLKQRADALIDIAAPEFRAELRKA